MGVAPSDPAAGSNPSPGTKYTRQGLWFVLCRIVGVATSDPAAGSNPSPAHFSPSRLSNTYWHDLGMKPKCAMIPGSFLRADSRGRRPGVAPHQTVRAISNSPRSDAIAVARASTVASTVVAEFHICYLVR